MNKIKERKSVILAEYFNTLSQQLIELDKKMIKRTEAVNKNINHLYLTDMYRTLHLTGDDAFLE